MYDSNDDCEHERPEYPAVPVFRDGERFSLGNAVYETTFNHALDRWVLQQLNDYVFLVVETDGTMAYLRFDRPTSRFERGQLSSWTADNLVRYVGAASYDLTEQGSHSSSEEGGCLRAVVFSFGALSTYCLSNVLIVVGVWAAVTVAGADRLLATGSYYLVVYTGGLGVGLPAVFLYAIAYALIKWRSQRPFGSASDWPVFRTVLVASASTSAVSFLFGFAFTAILVRS